jgi:hypothetical protein
MARPDLGSWSAETHAGMRAWSDMPSLPASWVMPWPVVKRSWLRSEERSVTGVVFSSDSHPDPIACNAE